MTVEISLDEARTVSDLRGLGKWKPRRLHANTHFCARNTVAGANKFFHDAARRIRRVTNDNELTRKPYLRKQSGVSAKER